jgi:sirohydrochlorin ferrochelatase
VSVGLVVFAHGSSIASANAAVEEVARSAADAGGFLVQVGFLDPVHPTLDEAVARLVEQGVTRVLIVPYFLTLGLHLQRDLPAIVERIANRYPAVEIRVTPPLDGHAALVRILLDRSAEALRDWPEAG